MSEPATQSGCQSQMLGSADEPSEADRAEASNLRKLEACAAECFSLGA